MRGAPIPSGRRVININFETSPHSRPALPVKGTFAWRFTPVVAGGSAGPGVEGVVHRVTQQVEGEEQQGQRENGEEQQMRIGAQD